MRLLLGLALSLAGASTAFLGAQNPPAAAADAESSASANASVAPPPPGLMARVIENQKRVDADLQVYERIERVESRRDENPGLVVKISRVVPAGTGVDHIPLGPNGLPSDERAYREALEKLVKSLAWAAQPGEAQSSAYAKIEKKRRERDALIDETPKAFVFTFEGREPRGSRMLARFRMEPNPVYKPRSRETAFFTKVRGTVWVDERAAELAKIEGQVTEDISIGIFLAKVYKGSYFMQERYPFQPGVWLPTFSQYDFDGRKFLISFAIHERTFYSNYKRVGPPTEALQIIRAELARSHSASPEASQSSDPPGAPSNGTALDKAARPDANQQNIAPILNSAPDP